MSYSTVPPLCGTLLSQLLHIQLTGTHAWWNAYNNNWYKDKHPPTRWKKERRGRLIILLNSTLLLSAIFVLGFNIPIIQKAINVPFAQVKIHKEISIIINSILWDHTNQLPPCQIIKLLRSFIVIIILWVIAMWKLTLAYLS